MMYAQTRNMTPYGDTGIADETQNFEAVAQYQFDFGLRPSLAWVYSKGKDMTYPGNAGNPQGQHGDMDLVNYIDVGMTYSFNKNFPPMLITKSTCWTTTKASTKQTASLQMTSLA